jgi:predicted transcriptional regulator of viral defense system
MSKFSGYIKFVRANGHLAFTSEEARLYLGISQNALNCGMYKLKKKGDVISPARNLYVIVPPEHQSIGCIPAEELIPIIMRHWGLDYYVALLSAAISYGASHQKPQIFQVITGKQIKPLVFGKIKIEFIFKKFFDDSFVRKKTVKTGYLNIASPELIACDLLHYPTHAGGLNHIATVLSELIEALDSEKLMALVRVTHDKAWVQRLGYILEHIDSMDPDNQAKLTSILKQYITGESVNPIPLASELPTKGFSRNPDWNIIENTTVESDL